MRLEYQIVSTGLDRFLRDQRTIEQELDKNARRDASRDNRRLQRRNQQRKTETRALVKDTSAAESKAADKAAVAAERARERAFRAEQRQLERQAGWRQRLQNRHYQQSERAARQSEAKIMSARKNAAMAFTRGAGRAVNGAFGALGTVARYGAGALAIGGAVALGGAVKSRVGLDAQLRGIANQGFKSGDKSLSREKIYGDAQRRVDTIAKNGSLPEDIAAAFSAIMAKTGSYPTAAGAVEDIERLSVATKTNIEEMGTAFGLAFNSLKQSGLNDEAAKNQALEYTRVLAGHGKYGAVEVADIAKEGGKLTGSAARFGGDRFQNLTDMSTMAQMAMNQSTSAEDAATAIKNLPSDLMKNGINTGVDVYDANRELRQIDELLPEIIDAVKGDQSKLFGKGKNKVFGMQSQAAIAPFIELYKNAGGGPLGKQAIVDKFKEYREQTMSDTEAKGSYAFENQGQSRQFQSAMNEFNRELGDVLVPVLKDLTPALKDMVPAIKEIVVKGVKLATWLSENPLKGLGLLVGGFMVKELAVAGIGKLLNMGVSAAFAAAGFPIAGAATGAAATGATTAAGTSLLARGGSTLLGAATSTAGMVAGGIAIGAGHLALGGQQIGQDMDARMAQEAKDKAAFGNTNLKAYMGIRASDQGAFSGSAGLDPSLQGSPAAIQAGLGGNGATPKIDGGALKALQGALASNTVALNEAAAAFSMVPAQVAPTRTSTILAR